MNKIPRQWIAMNRTLINAGRMNVFLFVLLVLSLGWVFYLSSRSPIVVVLDKEKIKFIQGKRKDIGLDEFHIKEFVEEFVRQYYTWKRFDPETMVGNVLPWITKGLEKKLREKLKKRKFKGEVSQRSFDIEVFIEKGILVAVFDKLVRMEGIPFVATIQVAFKLKKGKTTRWNPSGIYIDGMVEHEKKN